MAGHKSLPDVALVRDWPVWVLRAKDGRTEIAMTAVVGLDCILAWEISNIAAIVKRLGELLVDMSLWSNVYSLDSA